MDRAEANPKGIRRAPQSSRPTCCAFMVLPQAASSSPDLKNWPTTRPTLGVAPKAWKVLRAGPWTTSAIVTQFGPPTPSRWFWIWPSTKATCRYRSGDKSPYSPLAFGSIVARARAAAKAPPTAEGAPQHVAAMHVGLLAKHECGHMSSDDMPSFVSDSRERFAIDEVRGTILNAGAAEQERTPRRRLVASSRMNLDFAVVNFAVMTGGLRRSSASVDSRT
jgi:hypothetical protein